MKHLKRIHIGVCILLWILWAVALILIGIGRENSDFFWKVAVPFNGVVIICSIIPVEPALFAVSTVMGIVRKESFTRMLPGIIFFVVTAVLWLAYIITHVALTGGV